MKTQYRYGFSVIPEEVKCPDSKFNEGENGTLFVEVDTWRSDRPVANFYYARNFAKWNEITEEGLKARFPKSFAKNDSGDEYTKRFD